MVRGLEALSSRMDKEELDAYLEEKKVKAIFSEMMLALVEEEPSDPQVFLADYLKTTHADKVAPNSSE